MDTHATLKSFYNEYGFDGNITNHYLKVMNSIGEKIKELCPLLPMKVTFHKNTNINDLFASRENTGVSFFDELHIEYDSPTGSMYSSVTGQFIADTFKKFKLPGIVTKDCTLQNDITGYYVLKGTEWFICNIENFITVDSCLSQGSDNFEHEFVINDRRTSSGELVHSRIYSIKDTKTIFFICNKLRVANSSSGDVSHVNILVVLLIIMSMFDTTANNTNNYTAISFTHENISLTKEQINHYLTMIENIINKKFNNIAKRTDIDYYKKTKENINDQELIDVLVTPPSNRDLDKYSTKLFMSIIKVVHKHYMADIKHIYNDLKEHLFIKFNTLIEAMMVLINGLCDKDKRKNVSYVDKDNLIYKRYDTVATITERDICYMFYDKYNKLLEDEKWSKMPDETRYKKFISSITLSGNTSLLTDKFIRSDLTLLSTVDTNGMVRTLSSKTYYDRLSCVRRIKTPSNSKTSNEDIRQITSNQCGFQCPSETPEGEDIGLTKALACTAVLSNGLTNKELKSMMKMLQDRNIFKSHLDIYNIQSKTLVHIKYMFDTLRDVIYNFDHDCADLNTLWDESYQIIQENIERLYNDNIERLYNDNNTNNSRIFNILEYNGITSQHNISVLYKLYSDINVARDILFDTYENYLNSDDQQSEYLQLLEYHIGLLDEIINHDTIIDLVENTFIASDKYMTLYINGLCVGWCTDAIIKRLTKLKLDNPTYAHISICKVNTPKEYNPSEIRIYTDTGRLLRPLLNVKYNCREMVDVIYASSNNIKIRTPDYMYGWTENIDDAKINRIDYLEIHPSFLLGITGCLTPLINHSPAARNTFDTSMNKQVISCDPYFLLAQNDNSKITVNSHKAILVTDMTRLIDTSKTGRKLRSSGFNLVVAVKSDGEEGTNQEDASIVCDSIINTGLTKTYNVRVQRSTKSTDSESTTSYVGVGNNLVSRENNEWGNVKIKYTPNIMYNELGIINNNFIVHPGAVVSSRLKVSNSQDDPPITIDKVKTIVKRPMRLCKVVTDKRSENSEIENLCYMYYKYKDLEVGDKMKCNAQKGVIGEIIPFANACMTSSGVTPELWMGPHGMPSRMTMNYYVEGFKNKKHLEESSLHKPLKQLDGTSFKYKNMALHIANNLHNYDKHEEHIIDYYNGRILKNKVTILVLRYSMLKHVVDDKVHARKEGSVTPLFGHAPKGIKNQGGYRLGNMEISAAIQHSAYSMIKDIFYNVGLMKVGVCNNRNCTMYSVIQSNDTECKIRSCNNPLIYFNMPRSTKVFTHALNTMNIKCKIQT